MDACTEVATRFCSEAGSWGHVALELLTFALIAWRTHRSVSKVSTKVDNTQTVLDQVHAQVKALSTPPPAAPVVIDRVNISALGPLPKDLLQSADDKGESP